MRTQRGNTTKSSISKITTIVILSFITVLSACGKQELNDRDVNVMKGSIIIGSLDWKEITSLSQSSNIRQHAGPVGDIDLPVMGSRCTGFLISEDVFMTNHHCVPTARHATGVTVVFNHLSNVSKSSFKKYKCDTFIGNDSKLDFALLKCQGSPGAKYGFVTLSDDSAVKNDPIYVVQQNCDYYTQSNCDFSKKYSKGKIVAVKDEYTHNADTLGGSSGSPVFSSTRNEVIAIHHAGYGNNGRGRGIENYAVPMHKIVQKIHDKFPSVSIGQGDGGDDGDDGGSTTPSVDFEPNNTLGSAAQVKATFSKSLGITSKTDNDYFKFNFSTSGTISVSVKFSHSAGDLDVRLINGSKKIVNKSESASNDESLTYKTNKSGIYYVKVYGYKGAKAKYVIDVKFTPDSTNNEPNNTAKTASPISFSQTMKKKISTNKDYDYYSFTLTKSTFVTGRLNFTHSAGDLDLYLLNSNEKTIDKSTSVKSVESFGRTLTAGKYYVVVLGYKGATGSYTLKVK